VQRRQPDVLLEGVLLPAEVLQLERDLVLDRQDARREQPRDAERDPLVGREG
jgi:hypothetical protein